MNSMLLAVRADSQTTEALLSDQAGEVQGRARVLNSQASSSKELLERVFAECAEGYAGPLTAVVALPGLFTAPLRRAATDTVAEALPSQTQLLVCDELEAELAGALGGGPGLVVRSGRDAIVGRVDEEGCFTRTEGEFEPLGQEGSALWLGTRTLQLVVRILQGRLPRSPRFEGMLTEHFGVQSLGQLVDRVESRAPDAEQIVALGVRTVELAAFPDPEPACRALLTRATRKLSELVHQSTPEAPAIAGGLTGTALLEPFAELMRSHSAHVRWHEPQGSPLQGCLWLAAAFREILDDGQVDASGPDLPNKVWLRAIRQASQT